MKHKHAFRSFAGAILLAIAIMFALGSPVPAADDTEGLPPLLKKMSTASDAAFWNAVYELSLRGREAEADLKTGLSSSDSDVRTGSAICASKIGMVSEAGDALFAVLTGTASETTLVRAAAATKYIAKANPDVATALSFRLKKQMSSMMGDFDRKIAVNEAIWHLEGSIEAISRLRDIARADDIDLRVKAVVTLARLGVKNVDRPLLEAISSEPGERGAMVRAILEADILMANAGSQSSPGEDRRIIELQKEQISALEDKNSRLDRRIKQIERKLADAGGNGQNDEGGISKYFNLLSHIMMLINNHYIDADKIDAEALFNAAAKGMARSLDKYSAYFTAEEMKKFHDEGIDRKYGGIGAYVEKRPRDGAFVIVRPIYSGPAFEAGLRSLDIVMEIDGRPTTGKDLTDLVSELRGDPGTQVVLTVWRKGWLRTKEFTLTRAEVKMNHIFSEMLPAGVGYIQQVTYGSDTDKKFKAALDDLFGREMKALIIDLRGNNGGYLIAAQRIADFFVEKGKVIVTSKRRAGPLHYIAEHNYEYPKIPICILVNGGSASAAEVFAGAMRDYGLAKLIGTTTFGKGVVQQPILLSPDIGGGELKITIARYYSPNDTTPDMTGYEPDIRVEFPEVEGWILEESVEMESHQLVLDYVADLAKKDHALVAKLANFDNFDISLYPGFEDLYKSLETRLPKEEIRRILRMRFRRIIDDERGARSPTNLQFDVQLQRAIIEALSGVGKDAGSIEEYKFFKDSFKDEEKDGDGEGF